MNPTRSTMFLKRLAEAAGDKQAEMDQYMALFEQARPSIEARAAEGDEEAIQLLVDYEEMQKLELKLVPHPDREGRVVLEWVRP